MIQPWKEVYWRNSKLAEAGLVRRLVEAIAIRQQKLRERDASSLPRRAFQAKTHAGISGARFEIDDSIPKDLACGVFRRRARYRADVRFSNAAGSIQHDCEPDHRSLAIRIYYADGDHGECIQDLLATNGPVSNTRDAEEFLDLIQSDLSRSLISRFLSLCVRSPRFAVRQILYRRDYMTKAVPSLATEQYWSRVPFAVGSVALKFRLRPESAFFSANSAQRGFNYLREELVARLAHQGIRFAFEIQRYLNEAKTPIEDATIKWSTAFETIAHLIIPQQDLTLAAAIQAQSDVEALAFSPWNTTVDFKPIGMLNRVRQPVYDTSADMRQGLRTQGIGLAPVTVHLGRGLFRGINVFLPWYRLWRSPGLANLSVIRDVARKRNLHDIPTGAFGRQFRNKPRLFTRQQLEWRHPSGRFNDLADPDMGCADSLLTRNIPLRDSRPDIDRLLTPNPRTISCELLARDTFKPIKQLNLLSAAWLQFQVHGWFAHERIRPENAAIADFIDIPLDPQDPWAHSHGSPMRVMRTPVSRDHHLAGELPAYRNTETHWWDASQIYASSQDRQLLLREHSNNGALCRLRFVNATQGGEEMLPVDPSTMSADRPYEGVDLTGFNDNYWLGLSLLHHLFAREHNAICVALEHEYPQFSQEDLFQKSRLIVAALLAKIHTLEWSPAILGHRTLEVAFDTYWHGIAGERVANWLKSISTDEVLHGLPGTDTMHHGVPYAMTEEFVAVYRMHPLLPDEITVHHLNGNTGPKLPLREIIGEFTRGAFRHIGFADGLYTFGKERPGQITLHNYPNELRHHRRMRQAGKGAEFVDVGTMDILRDRERGVPRYNDFRRLLNLRPARSFYSLTQNRESARELKRIYGHVDAVDAMIGMLAEECPPGFGFSETAFRVFIVMAARRLLSDRFFTTDFRPEIYTPLGLEWINTSTLKSVLLRHAPQLSNALLGCGNVFKPW